MIFGTIIEADGRLTTNEASNGGFPTLPERAVERRHVIETMFELPTEDHSVVFVEGEDGCGATTLLAQFCLASVVPCFHLFVRPHSRFAYSVPYLRFVLAEQFCSYLGRDLPNDSVADDGEFDALLLAVKKKKRGEALYFVVDGLHQVPKEGRRHVKNIFTNVLSIGVEGFRFLITGQQEDFQEYLPGVRSKTYPVQRMSNDEAALFFDDLQLDKRIGDELIGVCKGLPGRLASVRRQIIAGGSAGSILAADVKGYPEFLSMELKPLDDVGAVERLILAIIAFSAYAIPKDDVLRLCDATEQSAESISRHCSFVTLRNSPPFCTYESDAHRRVAASRLESLRTTALSIQIAHLSANPDSLEALQFLPAYLQQANQLRTLVDMISPEHYQQLLDKTQSVSTLRERAALGAKSAKELKLAIETFQFSLQRSIFFDVAQARSFQAQVAALVALGQPQRALEVASNASTKEWRLRMLAEYARMMRESGGRLDKEVIDVIKELASGSNFDSWKEAEELAENVAFVDPDLAISILDRSNLTDGDKFQRDEALLKVSVAASVSRAQDNAAIVEKTSRQISDERLRAVIGFISSYFGDISAVQISEIAGPMTIERRFYFLRSILASADGRSASLDILEYALQQLVGETTYLPRIRDFIDFATPLGFEGVDVERAQVLFRRMEGLIALVGEAATSSDRMRLQVKLARAEVLFDKPAARERLVDAYLQATDMSAAETKVECLAVLLHALRDIDRDGAIEKSEHLVELVSGDLVGSIDKLLNLTASHFEVVRPTLSAITKFDVDSAVHIVERLNTRMARDAAYGHVVEVALAGPRRRTHTTNLVDIVNRIADPELRDECISNAIAGCRRCNFVVDWLDVLLDLVRTASTPRGICSAATSLLRFVPCEVVEHTDELMTRVNVALAKITSPAEAVSARFRCASALARTNRALALQLYESAEEVRSSSRIATVASEATIKLVLSLLIRAARPLIKFDELGDTYLTRMVRLFGLLPDPLSRAAYLVDLALNAWCEQRVELCRRIVQQYCRPILDDFEKGTQSFTDLATILFPAVFVARGAQAFELLENVNSEKRDEALQSCCHVVIRKAAGADPWSGDATGCVLSLDDAEDVVRLIAQMRSDAPVFVATRMFVDAMVNRRTKQKITAQQRVALRQRLHAFVESVLPDQENIKHDGYLIVCQAQLGRLSENQSVFWQDLRRRAEAIDNVADKVLVLLQIAVCLPAKLSVEKSELFKRAKNAIAEIPSAYDRYGRLNELVQCARDTEPTMARSALKDALDLTFELDNEGAAAKSRRELLDVADRIDPKLVDSLIDAIDEDPARADAKAKLVAQARVQRARRRIADARCAVEKEDTGEDVLPSAAWKTVAALVSGRAEPQKVERLMEYVAACGGWNLHNAFPVLSWYIENLGRRVMRADDVSSMVAPIWEALALSTELAVNVIGNDSSRRQRLIADVRNADGGVLVGRAEGREGALKFLRMWLRDHSGELSQLVLCDPYFGVGDMEFVRLVLGECPDKGLTVLTSKKALGAAGADDFAKAWSDVVDQDPPDVEIVAISDPGDSRSPVHDRWLLGDSAGLRLGTSMGGFGGRLSEISALDPGAVSELRARLRPFVDRERFVEGNRISYVAFQL